MANNSDENRSELEPGPSGNGARTDHQRSHAPADTVIAMRSTIIISALVLALGVMKIPAHEGATGVVKQRMDAMADIGKALKELNRYMRGKRAYDAGAVRDLARRIEQRAGRGGG